MNTKPIRLLLACSFLSAGTSAAIAQSKTGTSISQFLLIEPSARVAGMGNTGVTNHDEIVSAYFNPGAIGLQTGYGVQFTHSSWLAGISYNYAAASLQTGDVGSLYLSVTSLTSGEIAVRTVELEHGTGEQYTVSNLALGLGFGRQISDRFSAGVQFNYIHEAIWHSSMFTFGLNIGTIYRISQSGLHIGASLSNFGLPAKYDGRDLRILYDQNPDKYGDNSSLPGQLFTDEYSLPVLFRVGLGWPMRLNENNRVELAVNAFHPSDNTESVSVGGEWMLYDIIAFRGGYQNLFLQDSEVGLTLGLGLQYDFEGYGFRFDYAWADHGRLDDAQRMTLGFKF